jgi:lipopolysaccharide assembly outer membrane protein LptD (OstA)
MIYLLFQPLEVKEQKFIDVPLFELKTFTMYELDKVGLRTILLGSGSKRFSDRYTVSDIDYTDNSAHYIANMKADNGVYKGDDVTLDGNVSYAREDGLTLTSQKAQYNKKTSIATVDTDYVAYRGKNVVKGSSIEYNSLTNKLTSTDVKVTYQLKENN